MYGGSARGNCKSAEATRGSEMFSGAAALFRGALPLELEAGQQQQWRSRRFEVWQHCLGEALPLDLEVHKQCSQMVRRSHKPNKTSGSGSAVSAGLPAQAGGLLRRQEAESKSTRLKAGRPTGTWRCGGLATVSEVRNLDEIWVKLVVALAERVAAG